MERRFVLFIVLSFAVLLGHFALMAYLNPPKKPPAKPPPLAREGEPGKEEPDRERPKPDEPPEPPPEVPAEQPPAEVPPAVEGQAEIPRQWVTLGSADPNDPYRMLVTLTNKGGAVGRIELSSPRYLDLDTRSGYLGSLVMDETLIDKAQRGKGCPVQVVGLGTPAAKAGLKPGDLIVALGGKQITGVKQFRLAMQKMKPKRDVELSVLRGGKKLAMTATLSRRPLQLIQPEGTDPLSFLLTLDRCGKQVLENQRKRDACLAQFAAELTVREEVLSALDVSDVDLAAGDIQIPSKRDGDKKWGPMPEAAKKAAEAWLLVHGEDEGPLFYSLSPTGARRRLSAEEIDAILYKLRQEKKQGRDAELFLELDGLELRSGNWEVVKAEATEAVFRRVLPVQGLEITKTYTLATVPREQINNPHYPAYHLTFEVEIRNVAQEARRVAYQLDGPTGLPAEGAWHANKAGRGWSAAGLRDLVASFEQMTPLLVTCSKIAKGDVPPPWKGQESLTFIGVDAQYFAAVMIPNKAQPGDIWFGQSQPLRVGPVDRKMLKKTNTSCRVIGKSGEDELEPGETLQHRFTVFVGPKVPRLLASDQYKLDELVYYGWFTWLAVPMVKTLHVFYAIVRNYGLAIILLTVLVRGCMFPLSRKQALGAKKMQELQPEIKKLQEKYKNDMEGRTKAQQDLFRKHNYNPLSGCLVLFIQLPIFVALYRALMVDIELRQAPLISQSVRWCSNLAAPDMLYRWESWMPEFVSSGVGIFGLGPYFNLLPILTIGLFIAQQKMFMPPATDDTTAMQQKMMKYMMVFMGLIFFKVASGLCIYFIASSLWGLAERQFLPKHAPAQPVQKTETRADAKARAKAQAAAAAKAKARQSAAGRDGTPAGKKKKKSRGRK